MTDQQQDKYLLPDSITPEPPASRNDHHERKLYGSKKRRTGDWLARGDISRDVAQKYEASDPDGNLKDDEVDQIESRDQLDEEYPELKKFTNRPPTPKRQR